VHRRIAVTALAIAVGAGLACGGKEAPSDEATTPLEAPPPATATAAAPGHPETEEALVRGFSAAIEARDLGALRALAAPELSADLRRLHDQDPDSFWAAGQEWVVRVASGFEITMSQQGVSDRWRALIRFGNEAEETVVFTRVDGRLLFLEL